MKIAEITVGGTKTRERRDASRRGGRRLPDPKACQRLAEQMLSLAMAAGADGAEVLVRDGTELEVKIRLGEPELIKEAGSRALGLRVLKDARAAVTYTSDFAPDAMERFARETVELAALAEPDPTGDLPAREEMAREVPDSICGTKLCSRRRRRGRPARAARRGGGAEVSTSGSPTPTAQSSGAPSAPRRSRRRRVLGFGARHARVVRRRADLRRRRRQEAQRRPTGVRRASRARSLDPEEVGLEAARRTVAKLGARKIPTCEAPVVFSPEAARGLLGQFAGVCRAALWRRAAIWPAAKARRWPRHCAIFDDPLIRRGPGSRPLRRRGAAEPHQRARLGGHPADVPLRRLRGAQARAALHRVGRARRRRRPASASRT